MKPNSYETLEHFLRCQLLEARQEAQLTQESMAEKLDVSPRALSNLEGGHNTFGLKTFLRFYLQFRRQRKEDEETFWREIELLMDDIDQSA